MVFWQYVIAILIGAVIGFFSSISLSRYESRKKQTEALISLLVELELNVELLNKILDQKHPGILLRLEKEMWNSHKSVITSLSYESQASIYNAYHYIHIVNSIIDNHLAFHGTGPGAWEARYINETKTAREPITNARDQLKVILTNKNNILKPNNKNKIAENSLKYIWHKTSTPSKVAFCFFVPTIIALFVIAIIHVSDEAYTWSVKAQWVSQSLSGILAFIAAWLGTRNKHFSSVLYWALYTFVLGMVFQLVNYF